MDRRGAKISGFLKKVQERFHPEEIILFGSRAGEESLKHSDYDIIVVSKEFEGVHFLDRIYLLLELWDYDYDVDILAYTPSEFRTKKKEIGIVSQAVKEGVALV